MKPNSPPPVVFRLARKDDSAHNQNVEAPITAATKIAPRVATPAKSDHYRQKPRKTSSGGSGRFISRLVATIASLRRHIAHVERQAEQVAEAAKKRSDGATRSVVEQRAAAAARKIRQTADIDRRDKLRTRARAACLAYAAGEVDAVSALREVSAALELNIPELDQPRD